jgi:SAM-dependent methyltransferase
VPHCPGLRRRGINRSVSATDYDGQIHRDYARGRALTADNIRLWMSAFADHLPPDRPLHGLDLGSGTGRFSPALADAFGPVLGVEPSGPMRRVAERESNHDHVRYVDGSAETIPAGDQSFDYCLLYLVWHHVVDRAVAAREIARVLRPGGVLLCRSQFSDHMADLWWLRHFPSGPEADAAMYRPLAQEIGVFAEAGLKPAPGLTWVDEPSLGTKVARLERLRTRTLSVLHRMSDADVATGLASLAREVLDEPDAPAPGEQVSLLVLKKAGGPSWT